jgi:hypothetical protein
MTLNIVVLEVQDWGSDVTEDEYLRLKTTLNVPFHRIKGFTIKITVTNLCTNTFNTKQDRQCRHNVTLRRISEILHICVCVSMRARTRERWHVNESACVHIDLLIQHATRVRHIVTSLLAPLAAPHLSTVSQTA